MFGKDHAAACLHQNPGLQMIGDEALKKRDVKTITSVMSTLLKIASANDVTYIPVILPSVVIVEEGLCTIQHHRPVM